jgi:hypothetical protein
MKQINDTLQSIVAMIGKVLNYLETIESRVGYLEGDHEDSARVEDLEGDHEGSDVGRHPVRFLVAVTACQSMVA